MSEQKYKEGVASLRIIDAALSSVLRTFEDISKTADSLERELNKEGSNGNE